MSSPLLEAQELSVSFPVRRGALRSAASRIVAVDAVTLRIERGECLALVGESGSGKTTLARALLRLVEPSAGRVLFDGVDLRTLPPGRLRRLRRDFQMVFQDSQGSLDPRRNVRQTLEEPLRIHSLADRRTVPRRVAELLDLVGLPRTLEGRYPHELSGGQRQRVCLARALATRPKLLVADEPLTALDVSIQAQILNLLSRLRGELGLTLLFIGHDLPVVEQVADRVAVMYLGRLVEQAPVADLFRRPLHPYSASLLAAAPVPDPAARGRRLLLRGEPPSPTAPPAGCRFHPRCPSARPRCAEDTPPLVEAEIDRLAACFYPGALDLGEGIRGREA
jgi:peptide/nickel transport system ATP-binding protein